MMQDRPFLCTLAAVLCLPVGIVGLLVCLVVPAPDRLGSALAKRLDTTFTSLKSRMEREQRQLEIDLEESQSAYRTEVIKSRLEEIKAFQTPNAREALSGLTGAGVSTLYWILRIAAAIVSVLFCASGFALLLSQARVARQLAIATGIAGVVVTIVGTYVNAFVASRALGRGVTAILTKLTVPGLELPPAPLAGGVVTAAAMAVSALIGIACLQYPLFLAIVCFTPEAEEAYRARD